jgi:hypothetical protein
MEEKNDEQDNILSVNVSSKKIIRFSGHVSTALNDSVESG